MNLSNLVLPLAAALCSTTALAKVDCSTLSINTNGYVAYSDEEVFPNPAKTTELKLSLARTPSKKSVCGVQLTSDSTSYSIQAKDISTLSQTLGDFGRGWTFDLLNARKAGNQIRYSQAATVNIDLPDGLLTRDVKVGGYFSGDLAATSLIAVRVNNGQLQPLLFNNRFRELHLDPKTVKKIELYIKTTNPVIWTRLLFDVPNSKMTFFKSSSFPTR